MKSQGHIESAAAIFIYKADATTQIAWEDASRIADVRCELHNRREEFLQGLNAWNSQAGLNPSNSFLAIYSHMGPAGVSPTEFGAANHSDANIISWSDLAAAIPRGIGTVWLVGCASNIMATESTQMHRTIRNYALVTTDTVAWLLLLPLFAFEISLDPIYYCTEMPTLIAAQLDRLRLGAQARSIEYYRPTPNGWMRFP